MTDARHTALPSDEPALEAPGVQASEDEDAAAGAPSCDRKWLVLAVVMFAQISIIVMITVVVVALPIIARDLGVDPSLGVWVTFVPMLVSAALCTPIGRVADIYGRKQLFFAGCTCHIVAQLLSANAPSFEVLLVARGLTGLGDALTKVTGSAIALSMFRAEERGFVVSMQTSIIVATISGGIAVGAFMLEWLSWRIIFWVNIPLIIGAIVLCSLVLPGEVHNDGKKDARAELDAVGTLLLIGVVASALVAVNRAAVWGLSNIFVLVMFSFALIGAPVFACQQRRSKAPLLPKCLIEDSFVQVTLLLTIFFEVNYHAAYLALPFFLQEVLHMKPSTVGLISMWRPASFATSSIFVGKILTSTLRQVMYSSVAGALCHTVTVTGYFAVLPVGLAREQLLYVLPIVLVFHGVGHGMIGPPLRAAGINRVHKDDLSAFTGFTMVIVTLTQVTGQNVFMSLTELGGGTTVEDAYFVPFGVLIPWSCIGTVGVFVFACWVWTQDLQLRSEEDERLETIERRSQQSKVGGVMCTLSKNLEIVEHNDLHGIELESPGKKVVEGVEAQLRTHDQVSLITRN